MTSNHSDTGYPVPIEGDFIVPDFRFESGDVLPQLRLHYRSIGEPERNAAGMVRNAVVILHGSGERFLTDDFGGVLFGPGRPLMPARISSSCRMRSGTVSRRSRATDYAQAFRTKAMSTWSGRSINS